MLDSLLQTLILDVVRPDPYVTPTGNHYGLVLAIAGGIMLLALLALLLVRRTITRTFDTLSYEEPPHATIRQRTYRQGRGV